MCSRLAVALGGVLAAVLLVELVLRWSHSVPEVANPLYSFHDSHPRLGWRGKPDIRLRFRRPQFDALIVHDGDGFRAPDAPPPAHPRRRVLVLGDSFTWGWGVSQGAVYTDHLQRRLADTAVINRGVNGFGTAQQLLLLEDELARAEADLVLLQFFFNDLHDNVSPKRGRRPLFTLDGARLVRPTGTLRPLHGPVRRWLKDHSRAFLLFDFTTRALRDAGDEAPLPTAPPPTIGPAVAAGPPPPGAPVTARLLAAMADTARRHGARFAIAYAPHHSELGPPGAVPPDIRAARAVAAGTAVGDVGWIDLTPALAAAAQRGEAVLFAGDDHWTARGHALVAEALLASGVFELPAQGGGGRGGIGGGEDGADDGDAVGTGGAHGGGGGRVDAADREQR